MGKKILARDVKFQTEKITLSVSESGKIVDIRNVGEWKGEQIKKRNKKIRMADDKFASLDVKDQIAILSHMIGYINASKDLILSGKQARTNEISKIFESMERMINNGYGKM